MKKFLLFSTVMFLSSMFAASVNAAGLWDSYIFINGSAAGNTYFLGGANSAASTAFNNVNLGTFASGASVTLNGGAANTWRTDGSQNMCGGTLYYRVYPVGSPSGGFTAVNLAYDNAYGNQGNNQRWVLSSGTTNLAAGLSLGSYTIEAYMESTGDDNSTGGCGMVYAQNNTGANFKATFSVCAPSMVALPAGTYTVGAGGCFPTIQAAVAHLNANGVAGAVVFNVAAGHTETLTARMTMTATGTMTNTITFQKSGSGANPKITSYTGTNITPSVIADGFWVLAGSDYITIDGIDLEEAAANTTTTTVMEFGYGLFKASVTNGSQNNTIKNCTITLNRVQNTSWTAPGHNGSTGIAVLNALHTATGAVIPTAASGTNSNNKFYSNTIQNCNAGFVFSGYVAVAGVGPTPDANTFLGDLGNDVGGSSAATGNTILNFGGGATTNPATGIFVAGGWSMNCSYNTVNNNNGSGVNHATTTRGIFFNTSTSTSANVDCNYNTITLKGGATTSQLTGIDMQAGGTAAGNTIKISNNTIQNCTYTTATSGSFQAISASTTATNVIVSNNTVSNNTLPGTGQFDAIIVASTPTNVTISDNTINNNSKTVTGTMNCIYTSGSATNVVVNNNTVAGNTITGGAATTTLYGGRVTTSTYSFTNNTINNNGITTMSGSSSGSVYGFANASSPPSETITGNTISNLYIGGTSTSSSHIIYGTHSNSISTSNKTINSNTIFNLSYTGSAGTAIVYGISNGTGATINIGKNKIHSLSSTGAGAIVTGVHLASGATINLSNNIVGNLTASAATGLNAINGINVLGSSAVNAYFNTVNLNATSSSATTFGSSCITFSSTATGLNLRNNILVNTSTPAQNSSNVASNGVSACLRRSSGTAATVPANYSTTSNNNVFWCNPTSGTNNHEIYLEGTSTITNLKNTLADMKTFMANRDQASFDENPTFVSTTGSDVTFLHINTSIATAIESGAVAISGFTDDFDGDTRNATTPDVGADEFAGTPAAPLISNVTITPNGQQCTATARVVSATIVPSSGTISSTLLNYTYNGVAQTPINMMNTSGNVWEGTIPAATPSNALVVWSIVSTNTLPLSSSYNGTTYQDDPLNGVVSTTTATPSVLCVGSSSVLKLNLAQAGTSTIGIGAISSSSSPAPFSGSYGGMKGQYIILASELTTAGFSAGNITQIGINFNASVTATYSGLSIQMGHTSLSAFSSTLSLQGGLTTVYGPTDLVNPTAGVYNFTFATPFEWNGTSNIIISTNWSNNTNTSTVAAVITTTTPFNSAQVHKRDSYTPANLLVLTGTQVGGSSTVSGVRPNFTIVGNKAPSATAFVWSDGTSNIGTTNPLTVNVGTNTTYSVTATLPSGCTTTASTTINNAVPAYTLGSVAATATNICVGSSSTLSATVTGGCIPYTYSWNDGTSVVSMAQSFSITPTVTKTYSVTITDNSGATLTGNATVNVNNPQPASITPATVCATNTNVTLAATPTNSSNTIVWYAAMTGGNELATGSSYTTSAITATTTYYVAEEERGTSVYGGRLAPTGTITSTLSNYGVVFDVTSQMLLQSVDVYASATGSNTINIVNSAGTVLFSKTFTLQGLGTTTAQAVPLNFVLPVGTGYRIVTTGTVIGMVREGSGITGYPMAIGSVGNVTSSYSSGTFSTTTYSFFYNIKAASIACQGVRNPVNATINTPPAITTSANLTRCANDAANILTVSSANDPNYTYAWSNSTTGASNSVNPTTTTTYTVTATDASGGVNNGCVITGTVVAAVNPNPIAIATIPVSPTVCVGSPVQVSINTGNTTATIGTGTTVTLPTSTSGTYMPNVYGHYFGGTKVQTLILASELSAAGLINGSIINSISFEVGTAGSDNLTDFRINMGNTALNAMSGSFVTGLSTVYSKASLTAPSAGFATILDLNTPFSWNGTSNIIIETIYSNNDGGNSSAIQTMKVSTTPFASTLSYRVDTQPISVVEAATTPTYTESERPNIRFGLAPSNYVWSPTTDLYTDAATTTPYAGTSAISLYAKPTATISYSVTATNSVGCMTTGAVSVTVNSRPTAVTSGGGTVCASATRPDVTFTFTGTSPYNFVYSDGTTSTTITAHNFNTYTVTAASAGTYTVTALTDANCAASAGDMTGSATVTVNPLPTPAITSANGTTLNCSITSLTLDAGTHTTYAWSDGTTTQMTSVNAANTYMVTVTDTNGCANSTSITVTSDTAAPTVNAGNDATVNFNMPSAALIASGNGVSYAWGSGETTTEINVSPTVTTTYSVTATGANGCTASDDVEVVADFVLPTADAGADVTVTCASPMATLTAMGGVGYAWSNGATTASTDVNPLTTTIYTVTVTAMNGGTDTDEVEVVSNKTSPTVMAGSDVTLTCTNPDVTLTATGGVSYTWDNGVAQGGVVIPTTMTTYSVTATAANGCTGSDDIIVSIDKTTPTASAGNDVTVNCTTPMTNLTATGGVSYEWSDGTFYPMTTVSPTVTTTYMVTVTGANGCTSTDDVMVSVDQIAPTADAGFDVTVNCTTPSTTLTATGGVSYVWDNGAAQGGSVTPTMTTTYMVTVTAANGCTSTDAMTVTTDKIAPTANAGADATVDCAMPSTVLSAIGGVAYAWNNSATQGGSVSPTVTTTYSVTVTDTNGCTASDDVMVSVDQTAPTADAGFDVTVTCATPMANLSATGGVSYAWSDASFYYSTTVAPTVTTTYNVTVTAANGCTSTDDVIVTVDQVAPDADAGADIVLTTASPNGTLTASGGVSYLWNTGETTVGINVSVTVTTTYIVTVTGANGCMAVDDVTVFYTNADILPPTFTFVPASYSVDCQNAGTILTEDQAEVLATATDDYPGVMVTCVQVSTKGTSATACNYYSYTVTNTWTATDDSGNTATASQVITVEDVTPPTMTTPPANTTISQNALVAGSPTAVTATDNCSTATVELLADVRTDIPKPLCHSVYYQLTRTWKATDACGNVSTTAQTFLVSDEVLLTCPANNTTLTTTSDGSNNYDCQTLLLASQNVKPTFSDVCDLSILRYTLTGATSGAGTGAVAGVLVNKGTTTVKYTAQFSSPVECTFNITVSDLQKPKINVTQPIVVIDACAWSDAAAVSGLLAGTPIPTDNCAVQTVSSADVDADLGTACKTKAPALKYLKSKVRTYTVTDASGNSATAQQTFYLRDNTPPTASCPSNLTIYIGNTNVVKTASYFNGSSTDNCGGAMSFTACTGASCTNFATSLTFTKAMLGGANSITRPYTLKAIDACSNFNTCTSNVTLRKAGTLTNGNNSTELMITDNDAASTDNTPQMPSDVVTTHGDMKCFPNPFNEDLNVQFNLTDDVENVTLKLYDNQGRLIQTLENGKSLAGLYNVRWNLAHLQANMYHICLELDGKCQKTQRVLMMK